MKQAPVILVAAPFLSVIRPALGISNLKAALAQHGIHSKIYYYNMRFAELIGVHLNELISGYWPHKALVGEWIFADLLYTTLDDRRDHQYLAFAQQNFNFTTAEISEMKRIRPLARRFVDEVTEELVDARPSLVAFTTMFHQNCSSLSIAAKLKKLDPTISVCFGGANCHGSMGRALFEAFSQIDFVCLGEADHSFPDFVSRFLQDKECASAPGILSRHALMSNDDESIIVNLDDLPIPDFTDFFEMLAKSSFGSKVAPSLAIETSRGCWWGAKQHCRFCGLNAFEMEYRSKSGARVLVELETMSERYGVNRFAAADNILNMKHIAGVFDVLAARQQDYKIFFEVKSNINREQLKRIALGGVTWIQPGIESLDDEILRTMTKGVTALQNIMLLRNCSELGVRPIWNILWGFPGEQPHQYQKMVRLLPFLEHLTPPSGCSKINLDRFSPYFEQANEFGFYNIQPAPAYAMIYDLPCSLVERLAYSFEGEWGGSSVEPFIAELRQGISNWRERAINGSGASVLARFEIDNYMFIKDTRSCAVETWRCLEPDEDWLLTELRSPASLGTVLLRSSEKGICAELVAQAMARLIGWGYVVKDGDRALSLVTIDEQVHRLEAMADCPLGWVNVGD